MSSKYERRVDLENNKYYEDNFGNNYLFLSILRNDLLLFNQFLELKNRNKEVDILVFLLHKDIKNNCILSYTKDNERFQKFVESNENYLYALRIIYDSSNKVHETEFIKKILATDVNNNDLKELIEIIMLKKKLIRHSHKLRDICGGIDIHKEMNNHLQILEKIDMTIFELNDLTYSTFQRCMLYRFFKKNCIDIDGMSSDLALEKYYKLLVSFLSSYSFFEFYLSVKDLFDEILKSREEFVRKIGGPYPPLQVSDIPNFIIDTFKGLRDLMVLVSEQGYNTKSITYKNALRIEKRFFETFSDIIKLLPSNITNKLNDIKQMKKTYDFSHNDSGCL